MSIGDPGCPDCAFCTASMARVRMVLMAVFSMADRSFATVRPGLCAMVRPRSVRRERFIVSRNDESAPLRRVDPPAGRRDGPLHLVGPPGAAVVLVQRRDVAEDRADDAPGLL